ncbi:uncharacterized protein IL334_001564 [Kwoniella shivajii]|uniref:Dihydrofolate reductase n=1 Tax=Kwoniella shivajii TaxID=564305 RepID=A0ABZ1CSA1_9TREE|nr:hypothetical protein IL334_001564 [Kwoniella shivajii]
MIPTLNRLKRMTQGRQSITAIVAATTSNGIGLNGGLPWRLPGEMKYFARVTTGESSSSSSPSKVNPDDQNVVIMGRKTWESIPSKFRPLKDRKNLVISRQGIDVSGSVNTSSYSSVTSALSSIPSSSSASSLSRLFLIGGSQLYTSSLTSDPPLVDRVLLTRIIEPEFQCDTFLEDFTSHASPQNGNKVWRKTSHEEMKEWVGWDVDEKHEEKGTKYKFEMWVLNDQ